MDTPVRPKYTLAAGQQIPNLTSFYFYIEEKYQRGLY
jgi:hypothetical protein